MMFPDVWAGQSWWLPAVGILAAGCVAVFLSYRQTAGSLGFRIFLSCLKVAAFALLAICLLEPMYRDTRPEPGANLLMVMADDSQSLQVKDQGATQTREESMFAQLNENTSWLNQLSETFEVRRYQFDQQLRPVANFSQFKADKRGTNLLDNLKLVAERFDGRPAAGIVVLTDGNELNRNEDLNQQLDRIDWEQLPPIYPVIVGQPSPSADLGIDRVVTTQTNFETAPVSLDVQMTVYGMDNQRVLVELLDETGEQLEKQEIAGVESGRKFSARFQTKPQKQGVNSYEVRASIAGVDLDKVTTRTSTEATMINNRQSIVVNRGRGPYRVLYVCGRPNWELKFLNRAMKDDPEVDLVSLVRIAKGEAKFSFRGRDGQKSNSLFRGFDSQDDDTTEQHDEPVFYRLGTKDSEELRGGFPKDPEDLFVYDGIILDDVESDFFNEDQKSLIHDFVNFRGGGLLMMGGQESFAGGSYDRTAIGEMMPVYLDRLAPAARNTNYQLDLTREGWLQAWVRVRSTESAEKKRLQEMPTFRTINRTDSIKPGATVLATVSGGSRKNIPALAVQPFGKGRVGAMLIGDFWRWHMRTDLSNNDHYKSWRQTLRWLVGDVPRRVELEASLRRGSLTSNQLQIRVRNEAFEPYDNAKIDLKVITPSGNEIPLTTSPTNEPGVYLANFTSTNPGVYRAVAAVNAADGSPIEQREYGWVCDPDRQEFETLVPNRNLLEQLAERSKGEVLELDEVGNLPSMLESRPVPISQTRTLPWWHQWWVFSIAIGMIVAEWGLRRWKGMP